MGLFSRTDGRQRQTIGRILIVEDEPLVAFDNEHALFQAGYEVIATVDRYELAVERMRQADVDLLIADIRLSGDKSGIDVALEARALSIPVLFSAGDCPEEAQALGLGWLAKPYSARDLVRSILAVDRLLSGVQPEATPAGLRLFESATG